MIIDNRKEESAAATAYPNEVDALLLPVLNRGSEDARGVLRVFCNAAEMGLEVSQLRDLSLDKAKPKTSGMSIRTTLVTSRNIGICREESSLLWSRVQEASMKSRPLAQVALHRRFTHRRHDLWLVRGLC